MQCVSVQPLVRTCVSAQDSQASGSATFNCRASNASSSQPLEASRGCHASPNSQPVRCNSGHPQPSQGTDGAAEPCQTSSAFAKCSPADSGAAWSSGVSGASGSSLGAVGQALIVTSRIDGYCRAVWDLLMQCADEYDEGSCLEDSSEGQPVPAAPVAPLAKFLAAIRMLVQHLILLRVQALHISAVANESDARSLLQHVLLWQHLRHNSVMELITLAMQQGAGSPPATGRGSNAAHGSFLMSAGVPLVQQAISQVHGSLTMYTTSDGESASKGGALDMMAVLRMLHCCSTRAPAQSADCNVDALSQDAASLHRAVAFISCNTQVVADLLTTANSTKQGGQMRHQQVFAALAYTSALLGNTAHASIQYSEVPAAATARMSVARYSGTAAQLYRRAKATILDARIQSTCLTGVPSAVGRSKISAAVNKAFRDMYLFPELKHLLRVWSPMLQGVVNDGLLPVDAVLGAQAAATSAFDTQGECLRFKVPSSGFLLIWSTCPHSPAHSLTPESSPRSPGCMSPSSRGDCFNTHANSGRNRSTTIVGLKRGSSEMLAGSPVQTLPTRAASDSILVELGRAPQPRVGPLDPSALNTSGDSGSNGSDSTNAGASGAGSDSGGSGGGSRAQPCPLKHDNTAFAVPPPRPARCSASAQLPGRLSVAAQAQKAAAMLIAVPPVALGQLAQPQPPSTAFGAALPGSVPVLASPATPS